LGEGLGEREIYKIHLPQLFLIGREKNNRLLLRRCTYIPAKGER